MKLMKIHNCLFIIAFILISCDRTIPHPEDISNMLLINYEESPIIAEGFVIRIDNNSKYCVQFPIGYNLKIFIETIDGITEIPNATRYIGEYPNQLEKKGDPQSSIFITFMPIIQDLLLIESGDFYVEISGNLCEDSSVIIQKRIPFEVKP